MAVGKNKKLNKNKGKGKKQGDIFKEKEWYDVKAPSYFTKRKVGFAVVSRSRGLKMAADGLKGRVYEVCLDDLQDDESNHRKIRLKVEDVQGRSILTNFNGMDFTTDKLKSLIKKWQSLVEAFCDIKTTDGYVLRVFVIGFTKKTKLQISKTSYAQSAQLKVIRAKMVDIVERETANCDLKELVAKFISDSISKEIEQSVQKIYPMHDVNVRKVKVLKQPRFDVSRLLELHGDSGAAAVTAADGTVAQPAGDFVEPVALDAV
jgi:small subunit ribosomal protein S3Ae